jgi:hypothetical protein
MVEKQGFKHFMLKEIYEQPGVVRTALETYIDTTWTADQAGGPISSGLPEDLLANPGTYSNCGLRHQLARQFGGQVSARAAGGACRPWCSTPQSFAIRRRP